MKNLLRVNIMLLGENLGRESFFPSLCSHNEIGTNVSIREVTAKGTVH